MSRSHGSSWGPCRLDELGAGVAVGRALPGLLLGGRGPAGRTERHPRSWGPSSVCALSPSSPTSSGYRRETEAWRRVRPGAQTSSGETPGVLLGGGLGVFHFPAWGSSACAPRRTSLLTALTAAVAWLHRGPGPVLTLGRRRWVEAHSFPIVGERVLGPWGCPVALSPVESPGWPCWPRRPGADSACARLTSVRPPAPKCRRCPFRREMLGLRPSERRDPLLSSPLPPPLRLSRSPVSLDSAGRRLGDRWPAGPFRWTQPSRCPSEPLESGERASGSWGRTARPWEGRGVVKCTEQHSALAVAELSHGHPASALPGAGGP